jgi:hypothetical protein
MGVVVEVAVGVQPALLPCAQTARPARERAVVVAALIGAARPMQTDVDEARGDLEWRLAAGEVVKAERDVALCQGAKDVVAEPCRVAELEGDPLALRLAVEKGRKERSGSWKTTGPSLSCSSASGS